MKYLKHTLRELEEIHSYLEKFVQLAVDEGIQADHVNPTNAHQRLAKRLKDFKALEAKALKIGYKSLPNALKALSMMTEGTAVTSLKQLPEVFHTVPHNWIFGKADSAPNKQDGFKPLSLSQAQRRHRTITPLLIEAWELTEGDQTTRDEIEYYYRTTSDVDFEKELYTYIHKLEPLPLEEQFKRALPMTPEDMEESLRLVTDPDIIYGVVKKKNRAKPSD
jgi:hypothetical protein